MSRTLDWLLIGGIAGGAYWYWRRERRDEGSRVDGDARHARHAYSPPSPLTPTADVEVDAPPAKASAITRRFDDLFRQHGQRIPVPYLRALAHAESGMNPNDALGLINVVPVALADFNRRHPEATVAPSQMREPANNIRVAADTLRTIIASYERNHGDIKNLRENWQNPRFVELASFGWNAGFSERAGVGRVVRALKDRKVPAADVTIDAVFRAAPGIAGVAEHLSNPRKLAYSKGVAATFFHERSRDGRERVATAPAVA